MAKVRVQDATRELSAHASKVLDDVARLRKQSQEVLGSLRRISDGFVREERERQEDILSIFETIGRDRMARQNGVEGEALTDAELSPLRVDGRKLLLSVLAARRMLSANVAWPNALDALYLSLV